MTINGRITRHISSLSIVAMLVAIFAFSASGQSNKGSIKGTVTDPNGAVVQNAKVTVTNISTNSSRTLTTGDDGAYTAPLLEPGKYKITVTAASFPETVRDNIV